MLNIIRLSLALFIMLFIAPQTSTKNRVIRKLAFMKIFLNYGQTKSAVMFVNRVSLTLFFLISIYTGINFSKFSWTI